MTLCSAFEETKHQLLAVEGHKALLSDPSAGLLQAKLALRAPYITPLNILQVTLEPNTLPCFVVDAVKMSTFRPDAGLLFKGAARAGCHRQNPRAV